MPGIYGFSGAERGNVNASLKAMNQAMLLYPEFDCDSSFVDNRVAASRVHLGKIGMSESPASDGEGNRTWIEGEVYNLTEVIRDFGWQCVETSNVQFSTWLLYAYQSEKLDAFLNKLDGYFCGAIYDVRRQKVLLVSDRHGTRMLYWYHRNGLFAWASEVKGLLALNEVDRTLDPTSLPCFMDLGYLMGEHTWFEHVHLIKPATVMEYDIHKDSISQRYYWTWGEVKSVTLSFDDAVDALYYAFINAVRRRFSPDERIGISLSGGLDSRAIFAAASLLYPDYEGYAYTFGIPDCDDIRIARQVASRSGWQHEEFHFTGTNWFEPRKRMVWNCDGMSDLMHMHGGEFQDRIAARIDVNMNGYAGDVVAGGGWIGTFPSGKRASASVLDRHYGTHGGKGFLGDSYFDGNNAEPGLYASRVRRFTNMGSVNNLVRIEQRKPFFDNDVIDCALSIPEEFRQGNRVYAAMLQRYFPDFFEDIPWHNTGKPVGVVSSPSRAFPARALRKAVRILKSYTGINDSKAYTDYANWIREPVIADELKKILVRSESQYQEITDQDWLRRYLEPHLSNPAVNKSNQILRAVTVELYLNQLAELGSSIHHAALYSAQADCPVSQ